MLRRFLLVGLSLCALVACDEGRALRPTSPDGAAGGDPNAQAVTARWSPYVGVHVTGEALDAYRDALMALRRAGRLSGVRVELFPGHQANDHAVRAIGSLGVELLALVSNEFLFDPHIEARIDGLFAAYPEVRHFQIGNEVTTILPPSGPTMTIEEYAAVFQRVYDHVTRRHPGRAVLLTQSSLGSGMRGPLELETHARLGLSQMDPARVIVAINAYDPEAVNQYRGLLGGTLRGFRVWVTESGVADPALHTAFVQERYPMLRNYLRAERIYWYVLWGGDSGPDTDFSLIKQPGHYPNYWKSPLFQVLTQTP
jgi:hypothetical protein